jgi:hypothetical protein
MLVETIETNHSLKENGLLTNINERVRYTANTGSILINVANPNLDGSGIVAQPLVGQPSLLKNITIKAIGNTTRGMVRLFTVNPISGVKGILDEIDIPAVVQSATTPAFEITYDINYYLILDQKLLVSTQNAEGFIVTVQALDISYP